MFESQGRGLCTAAELAEILSVEPRTVHNWAESGAIPVAVRIGRTIRFDLDHVSQALSEHTARKQQLKEDLVEFRRSEHKGNLECRSQAAETNMPWN